MRATRRAWNEKKPIANPEQTRSEAHGIGPLRFCESGSDIHNRSARSPKVTITVGQGHLVATRARSHHITAHDWPQGRLAQVRSSPSAAGKGTKRSLPPSRVRVRPPRPSVGGLQRWRRSVKSSGRRVSRIIEAWRIDYNVNRPHTSLEGQTPTEFAKRLPSPRPASLELRNGSAQPVLTATISTERNRNGFYT